MNPSMKVTLEGAVPKEINPEDVNPKGGWAMDIAKKVYSGCYGRRADTRAKLVLRQLDSCAIMLATRVRVSYSGAGIILSAADLCTDEIGVSQIFRPQWSDCNKLICHLGCS